MSENSEKKEITWYVAHTYSGYENKVKDSLEKSIINNGLQDEIAEVCIPVEEVVEIKNNKRRVVQHKLLPGYVLVKMHMTNETWYHVRNTRGVTGFVGSDNKKPTPLSETDFAKIFSSVPKTRIDIEVGDEVRILSGMFENLTGKIMSIDLENQKVKVNVSWLSRETEVELAYDEVVRVD